MDISDLVPQHKRGLPKETIAELKHDLFEIVHNPSVSDKASEMTSKELNMID